MSVLSRSYKESDITITNIMAGKQLA